LIASTAAGCKLLPAREHRGAQSADEPSATAQARELAEAGLKFEQVGNDRRAYKCYKKAVELAPRSAWLHHRLAATCDRLGKFNEAEHHYLRALAIAPRNPDLHNDLGYSYYLQGRLAEAERELRACLAFSPSHANAHVNLGLVLGRMGNAEESLRHFQLAGMSQQQAYASLAFVLPRRKPAAREPQTRLAGGTMPDIPPELQRYFEPASDAQAGTNNTPVRLGQHLEPVQ
jgi:Flp pilus assembly protein TadD